jgi:hypothetical protein
MHGLVAAAISRLFICSESGGKFLFIVESFLLALRLAGLSDRTHVLTASRPGVLKKALAIGASFVQPRSGSAAAISQNYGI